LKFLKKKKSWFISTSQTSTQCPSCKHYCCQKKTLPPRNQRQPHKNVNGTNSLVLSREGCHGRNWLWSLDFAKCSFYMPIAWSSQTKTMQRR